MRDGEWGYGAGGLVGGSRDMGEGEGEGTGGASVCVRTADVSRLIGMRDRR